VARRDDPHWRSGLPTLSREMILSMMMWMYERAAAARLTSSIVSSSSVHALCRRLTRAAVCDATGAAAAAADDDTWSSLVTRHQCCTPLVRDHPCRSTVSFRPAQARGTAMHCIYAVELISKALRTVQCSTGVLTPMFTSSAFEFNLSRVYC
jgi:hypothetical protein